MLFVIVCKVVNNNKPMNHVRIVQSVYVNDVTLDDCLMAMAAIKLIGLGATRTANHFYDIL